MNSHSYSSSSILRRGKSLYVETLLYGGAPWGFTLKGGIEHGEKLIISKVEEGGKAGLLQHPLEPGDKVVAINHVELSGSRQEAISLVKGSYKTLHLIVSRECSSDPYCSESATQSLPGFPLSQEHPQVTQGCTAGVKLRIRKRQSGPTSRPHSWHSTKLGEGQQDPSMMQISAGNMTAPWQPTYHSSFSATDLSNCDTGILRKSPDQYSSRGSMESLDHVHPAYSSCHQLSSAKSSNSIDNKRDSAYSSFSNSSSIPEYPASAASFSKERSYSMDSMLSQRGPEGMRQADIRYVRTVYDPQQGISEQHQISSAKVLRSDEGRTHTVSTIHGSNSGGISSSSLFTRNSLGSMWDQKHGRNSYESLRGGPPPPLRSDSYAAIKNHERPNSWSSLEQTRSLRALPKGPWHHPSASVTLVKSFTPEGQLHTVVEKSPESSPTTKPKQNFPQASQTGHPMLPMGIYPVPQPEPHFAQVPGYYPNSGSVFPTLAKESMYPSYGDQERELNPDQSKMEKKCQSHTSSTGSQHTNTTKPKPLTYHDGRRHDDSDLKYGHYRAHVKTTVDGYGATQNQEDGYRHVGQHLTQERRDPYTRGKQWEEKPKHFENSEVCKPTREEMENKPTAKPEVTHLQKDSSSTVAQDGSTCTQETCGRQRDISVPISQIGRSDSPHTQKSHSMSRVFARHYSDSDALQKQKQQDHPLTKLENALMQVQTSAGSEGPPGRCGTQSDKDETDAMHLSVLEKVSRFEQREKMRSCSQSDILPSHARLSCPSHLFPNKRTEPKDSSGAKAWSHSRTQSCSIERKETAWPEGNKEPHHFSVCLQTCGSQNPPLRNPHGKPVAIQRSKSTFQLGGENDKEFQWKEDLQDILSTIPDFSLNRAYRDSIKDAQSKVLRSTSFRRRDLSASSVPSKHLSLERKPPKTSPKPIIASPHTPKERHIVTPDVQQSTPPPLPSVPAVGHPVTRIGGRKRLTVEQKKRSYSEPENMHEVGLSPSEEMQKRVPQQFFIPETSVADKCKLFEMAASKSTGPSLSLSRPELKQIQQDALVDYMERKTGRRSSAPSHPTSAHVRVSSSDSNNACTSVFSFDQEQGVPFTPISGVQKGRNHTLYNVGSNQRGTTYPNDNTSEMARLKSSSNYPESLHNEKENLKLHFSQEKALHRSDAVISSTPGQNKFNLPTQEETFVRGAPSRNSGKSASAEDLLHCANEERAIPQHYKSQSSPCMEKYSKDLSGEGHVGSEVFSKVSLLSYTSDSRLTKNADQDQCSVSLEREASHLVNWDLSQLSTPAVQSERPKSTERQRSHGATGLAASVGLPCTFSPPPCSARLNWQADKKLCPAGLDSYAHDTFPSLWQDGRPCAENQASLAALMSFAVNRMSEETPKEGPESRTLATQNMPSSACATGLQDPLPGGSCSTSSQMDSPSASQPQTLLSLHISESNLQTAVPSLSFKDFDNDVFIEDPTLPTQTPPPNWEMDISEGFAPPRPVHPPAGEEQSVNTLNSRSADRETAESIPFLLGQIKSSDSQSVPILPRLGLVDETQSPPVNVTVQSETSIASDDQEGLQESPLLCRRERSAAEMRVEALARVLVTRDKSLAPVLGTGTVKSTMDLMEDIFPTLSLPLWQEKRSQQIEERHQDQNSVPDNKQLQNKNIGMETDLDKEDEDVNQKKKELVEALTASVVVLREEKEGLAEEQKNFGALEGCVEALIQEYCKPNERDKYHMFIGDLDKIVNLLLSLCSRLARVENTLAALDNQDTEDSAKERESLELKRRQLCRQQEDARELKENLDRRQRVVFEILAGYFSKEQLRDYQRFVHTKPALLIRQRCLDDLIRQGEEQLEGLRDRLLSEGQMHTQTEGLTSIVVSSAGCSPAVTSL